jgi:endonuclease/exonuclease/phosphatase family metal-dependent hydrolase
MSRTASRRNAREGSGCGPFRISPRPEVSIRVLSIRRASALSLTSTKWWATALFLAALSGQSLPVAAQPALCIVSYNIKHGLGMDGAVDLERIATVLRRLDADVITLQEVDDRTERTGRVDQVGVLARLLGYEGSHGPHRAYQGGFYGNAILTRLPVVSVHTRSIPGASGSALSVHEVVVRVGTEETGRPVSVVSVHLAGSPDERMAQAESVTRDFAETDHPVLLAGDFNGRPDDAVVRRLASDWTALKKDGSGLTFPADTPDREIDFVMIRNRDEFETLEHRVIDEPIASDHRPILAVVRIR